MSTLVLVSYWFARLCAREPVGAGSSFCPTGEPMGTDLLCLPPAFTLVSCLAYPSNLKMEATCSSQTSVDFQRTTRRYIPEDRTLHNHRCENLKYYSLWTPQRERDVLDIYGNTENHLLSIGLVY
jgi:hypothetical protein